MLKTLENPQFLEGKDIQKLIWVKITLMVSGLKQEYQQS